MVNNQHEIRLRVGAAYYLLYSDNIYSTWGFSKRVRCGQWYITCLRRRWIYNLSQGMSLISLHQLVDLPDASTCATEILKHYYG